MIQPATKSCATQLPIQRNCATFRGENATTPATTNATLPKESLRYLASRVLGRNKPRNFCATRPQKQRNFTATNEPKKLRQLHSMDTYSCFKLHELRDAAGDDWADIKDSPALLTAFASALRDNAMRSIGELPDHYIKLVQCLHCGPVKLWESCPDVVLGCPWCLTKRKINEQYV